jgi:hypothetical protein
MSTERSRKLWPYQKWQGRGGIIRDFLDQSKEIIQNEDELGTKTIFKTNR